jgi:hypothetical protein
MRKSLASNRTYGYEAIMIAAYSWWSSVNPLVLDIIDTTDLKTNSLSRVNDALGRDFDEILCLYDRIAKFWTDVRNIPALKYMIEEAVRDWKVPEPGFRVPKAKNFLSNLVFEEAGQKLKDSRLIDQYLVQQKKNRKSSNISM